MDEIINLNACDLIWDIGGLFTELEPHTTEQARLALALLWEALEQEKDPEVIQNAIVDLIRECIDPQA